MQSSKHKFLKPLVSGTIDGGTSAADGTPEKTLNLQIAEKLRLMLDAMGVKTVMTRSDDDSIHDP